MSKGKEFRERRRRGFDDDDFTPPRRSSFGGAAPRFAAPRPVPAPAGPPVAATVKWFNPEKGFGFAELADGAGDAFLHVAVLERSGHSTVSPGARLQVRVGAGQKGPQVTEILEVDESTATVAPPRRSGPRPPAGDTVQMTGSVKWYNPDKGFGFIAVDGGGKDVFVHVSALQRSGLPSLAEAQRVTIEVGEGRKGPEAVAVRPAD